MSDHPATIQWRRTTPGFGLREYNTGHAWLFDSGVTVRGSPAAAFRGEADSVDPEEAFTAALASCHLLSFLYCAARAGVVVDAYEDHAVGEMHKADDGRPWVARVTLRPKVTLADPAQRDKVDKLHREAHEMCFIARSVKSEVVIEPIS